VSELAQEISEFYKDKNVLLLGILKGAVPFMADLSRALTIPVQQDWMAVSSYGSGTVSSGVVRILKDLDADIKDRNAFVVGYGLDYNENYRSLDGVGILSPSVYS